MKPIQVLAGIVAIIFVIVVGGCFSAPASQPEPTLTQGESTIAATEVTMAVAEPEIPTDTPAIPPTKTSIPPTQTPLPPVPTATPAAATITTVEELVGIWQVIHGRGNEARNVIRFRADGVLEVAESLAALEASEVKARADFYFEDGEWRSQLLSGVWLDSALCVPRTGRYEIRPVGEDTIKFGKIIDGCSGRFYGLSQASTLTLLDGADEDWLSDPETGFLLNPGEFPTDNQFVLVGTMLNFDASDRDAPAVTLRLPSGQVVEMITPPLTEIVIDGDDAPDLTAYDPTYPVRVRLLVQLQDDDSLQGVEMVVLTTLK